MATTPFDALKDYRQSLQNLIKSKNNTRITLQANTGVLTNNQTANVELTRAAQSYMVLEVFANAASWIRFYDSNENRGADNTRVITADPESNSGVILEIVTAGADNTLVTPGVMGFTSNITANSTTIPLRVTNRSGADTSINLRVKMLVLEE